MEQLTDLLEDMLQDVYFAEKAVLKALPKMAEHATSPALRAGFEKHIGETEGQVKRLEQVFEILGKKAKAKECPAMMGLIEEATELMDDVPPSALLDAGLAAHARAVEHYEIARYVAMHEWADTLGHDNICKLLAETLDQEEACEEALTKLATTNLNAAAAGERDEAEDGDEESHTAATKGRAAPSRSEKSA
jgi:ferritin-like metal-binding protein YciE